MGPSKALSVSIHQPNYIPWLGYFYKIFQADYFVFLDDVQFSNQGMHNYHYVKTNKGPQRIKIPVIQTLGDRVNEVMLRNELNWQEKHLNLIKENYINCDHFDEVFSDFSDLINEKHEYLSCLNISVIKFLCKKLGLTPEFVISSDLNITTAKEQKILDICHALGCEVYISGTGARAYQSDQHFKENGILLKYSEFKPFKYRQQFEDFQSNVTILDYLMNYGYDWRMVSMQQAFA
jgi:hypothetical protein